jgi:hypothetical protein
MEEEDSKSKLPLTLGKHGNADILTVDNPVVEKPTVEMVCDSWTILPPKGVSCLCVAYRLQCEFVPHSNANLYLTTKCAHHMRICLYARGNMAEVKNDRTRARVKEK